MIMAEMSTSRRNEPGNPLDIFQRFYLHKGFPGVGRLGKAIMNPRAVPPQILTCKAKENVSWRYDVPS